MPATTLLWLRRDLRLGDHPALDAARRRGGPVVPVFVWAPDEDDGWPPGAASRWWLHHSLEALAGDLEGIGSRLIVRAGSSLDELRDVAAATGAAAIVWSRLYEPEAMARDARVEKALRAGGLEVETMNGSLLSEPWDLLNRSGRPFQVFTPFERALAKRPAPPPPRRAPRALMAPRVWPRGATIESLRLLPEIDWAEGLRRRWRPGERGAAQALARFRRRAASSYASGRDLLGESGTSLLSPHLHFGEIGPRQIRRALSGPRRGGKGRSGGGRRGGVDAFLRQIAWREFAHHLLFCFPRTPEHPLRERFERFPWARDAAALRAWKRGRTGYPMVDAGMRELWRTGWMHNRARMVTGSFLVKHLLIPWREGARWFWDTLVDADLANNTLGWQWVAGCGADAAPYFRIFNPVAQGERFDPRGAYVRAWVPEIAALPDRWIHRPWEAPPEVLKAAGVELGRTYPKPIVGHARARQRALDAFAAAREEARIAGAGSR